ncbi:hypothetical protein C8Q78DRAFT_1006386 [Trametes maxima]|nr:hypothetical protein C8Q78DRAFT_1006386 [Trametes maxima]
MTADYRYVGEPALGGPRGGCLNTGEDGSDVAEYGSQEDLANLERALYPGVPGRHRGLSALVVDLAIVVKKAIRQSVLVVTKRLVRKD